MVFLGTSVVSGTATAEVVATGPRTAFGDIAARLGARPEETAFDLGLRDFSQLLARTVFFLVLFLIVVSVVRHRDPLQSLMFAVALAVGLTPEFLPMITSVTLSKGAVAMARKKVIVKHLSAIREPRQPGCACAATRRGRSPREPCRSIAPRCIREAIQPRTRTRILQQQVRNRHSQPTR